MYCLRVLALAAVVVACADPSEEPVGGPSEAGFGGKSDGLCPDEESKQAVGMLALVNDSNRSFEFFDRPAGEGGVGLDRRAAENIVAARPFTSVKELSAIPFVGSSACAALENFACDEAELCVESFDVATWNLQHFPRHAGTVAAAAEEIIVLGSEVVGLQEVTDVDALFQLADELPGFTAIAGDKGPFTRVGLVFNEDRADVVEIEHLFVDDGFAFPRPILAVRFSIHDGSEIFVLVAHLKAKPDDKSATRRRAASVKLAEWIEAQSIPVILVGDLNDEISDSPSEQVFAALIESPSIDFTTWAAADESDYSYVVFKRLLDHIAVSTMATQDLRPQRGEVVHIEDRRSDYRQVLSDHVPVTTRFLPLP